MKKKGFKLVLSALAATSFIATTVSYSNAQSYAPQYNNTTPGASYNLNQTQSYNYNQQGQQNYAQPVQNYTQPNYANSTQPVQNYTTTQQSNYMPPLQGRVVTVPAGATMSTTATQTISTEFLSTGDTLSVVLGTPFYYGGALVAPAGSMINGNVVIGEAAGRAGKNGKLKVRFTSIMTPQGQHIPISGKIRTEDGTGLLVGGTSKDRAVSAVKKTAVGAGAGALTGTIFGALSGGKVGKGAALGSAVGGGLGLGKTLLDKGQNVLIPANSRVDIEFDQPVTVNPSTMPAPAYNKY